MKAELSDGRWQLRQAAGRWWLLDTAQTGSPYVPPIQLNDTGARLWQLARDGASPAEMAADLCGSSPPTPEALEDAEAFLRQLREALAR